MNNNKMKDTDEDLVSYLTEELEVFALAYPDDHEKMYMLILNLLSTFGAKALSKLPPNSIRMSSNELARGVLEDVAAFLYVDPAEMSLASICLELMGGYKQMQEYKKVLQVRANRELQKAQRTQFKSKVQREIDRNKEQMEACKKRQGEITAPPVLNPFRDPYRWEKPFQPPFQQVDRFRVSFPGESPITCISSYPLSSRSVIAIYNFE